MVLLDTKGIAELIGMSRGHVTNRLTKRPDFPAPVVNISQRTRRWRLKDVQSWVKDVSARNRI